jgi:hypothetical protein
MRIRLAALGCVLFLLSGMMLAQSDRASITGVVKDVTGAVIPGVQVVATNDETKVQTSVTSNSLGLYSVLNLPIGHYSVTFRRDGFKALERRGIELSVNQTAGVDVTLDVGATNEVVTVTEDAPILQTEDTSTGVNLKNKIISEMPLTVASSNVGGRVLENFAYATVPGVEGDNWKEHIAGSAGSTKEVLIDGTSAITYIGGHITESSPSMEAVEEFQVSTSALRAEDGKSGGGVFRFNMKSGTNSYHGSAFGFLHNEVLNANTWWNNLQAVDDPENAIYKRAKDRKFDWGGSFGGPIRKEKTFFFAAFERYTQDDRALSSPGETVPIEAFLNGDFSAILGAPILDGSGNPYINPCTGQAYLQNQIFDWTTRQVIGGQMCATPFAGNVIPADRISAVSQQIADVYRQYYAPQGSGLVRNNARPNQVQPFMHQNQFSVKVDHKLTEKDQLNGSYIYTRRPRALVEGGIWQAGSTDGGPFSQARNHYVHADALRISETRTFSSNVLNVFSATYNHFRNPQFSFSEGQDWGSTLGLYEGGPGNFPVVNFQGDHNGLWMTGIGSASSNQYVANTYFFNDNLSWVRGRHTFKFGADFRAFQGNSHADHDVGTFNFTSGTTGLPTAPTDVANNTGFAFASFMLGQVDSADMKVANNLYGRRKSFSAYIQDDVKITDKLTANFDLRWDFNGRFHEKNGRWSNYNVDEINPVTGIKGVMEYAQSGSDSFETNQFWTNFAPRIGAAYQLTQKTVVRGSWGIFYSPLNLNYWSGVPYGFDPGFYGQNKVESGVPQGDFNPRFNWDNGYPGQPTQPTQDPNYTQWGLVVTDPDAAKPGRIQQWSVDVQRELTSDLRLRVGYMANRGTNLQSGFLRGNQPDPTVYGDLLKRGTQWNWVASQADADAAGVPYPYAGWAGLALYAVFPYPDAASYWGPMFFVGSPLGKSDYNSFQFQVTKRTSHGLSMDMSYTLSSAHGNVADGFQEQWWAGPIQNIYDLEKEAKTIQPFDQTHVVKGYVSYELPFGRGKWLLGGSGHTLDAIVNGWTVTGIVKYNTGNPLRVTSSNWYPIWNNVYANVDPNGDFSNHFDASAFPDSTDFFDPAAFSNPANGEFGNAPGYLSQLRGFGWASEDIGVMKDFAFGSDARYKLQVRFELYNAFNRHHFGNPDTNIASPTFGQVTGMWGDPRQGQLGARFSF